jgi:hypothetical protein
MYPSADVPTGVPIGASDVTVSTTKTEALQALSGQGFPRGLAAECVASAEAFPIRLWIVDNSGSMQASDGSMLVKLASGGTRKTSCSRWQELAATLGAIGDLSQAVGARTDFMLLNPTFSAPQFVSVATHAGAQPLPVPILGQEIDAARLRSLMEGVSPAGTTPLTEAVQRVISLVLPVAPALQARGQQAVVVLATDGQPNDPPSFLAAMQQLQRLPVWLVVRVQITPRAATCTCTCTCALATRTPVPPCCTWPSRGARALA